MSITAAPEAATRLARVLPPPSHPDPTTRLPLRTELFLIAHDDDTGRPHLDPRRLEAALAGAVLLELWLARRIHIGWRCDARTGRWVRDPGRITVLREDPLGDPLADTALTTLRYSTMRVGEFVARFAATGLYERVRADMVATGILRRDVWRRFGLFRRERHLSVHPAHVVRARTRVLVLASQHRYVVNALRNRRYLASTAAGQQADPLRLPGPPEPPAPGPPPTRCPCQTTTASGSPRC